MVLACVFARKSLLWGTILFVVLASFCCEVTKGFFLFKTARRSAIIDIPPLQAEPWGSHSYVEGLEFDDQLDEILAMGGDPSFLMDDDDEMKTTMEVQPPPEMVPPYAPSDVNDTKNYLWDGEVNEDAYFDD